MKKIYRATMGLAMMGAAFTGEMLKHDAVIRSGAQELTDCYKTLDGTEAEACASSVGDANGYVALGFAELATVDGGIAFGKQLYNAVRDGDDEPQ